MDGLREFLYDRFENFDKPDENEFRKFIDAALEPVTFINRTVTNESDLYTDINQETFAISLRLSYLIYYGTETYILYGKEGVYGLGGLEITSANIAHIGNASSGSLSQSLTVNTSITGAGIKLGDFFDQGTPFEDIFRALLIKTSISNLRYQGSTTSSFLRIGSTLNITKFLWTIGGEPKDLRLEDSEGTFGQDVDGNQVTVDLSYTFNAFKAVTWTLFSSNAGNISKTAYWVEPSYYGTNTNGATPTAAQILAGTEVLTLTADYIEVPIGTAIEEYGWIAVENTQTGRIYNTWKISEFNTAGIGSTEFMRYVGNVLVEGDYYNVYIFNYPSLVSKIKLL